MVAILLVVEKSDTKIFSYSAESNSTGDVGRSPRKVVSSLDSEFFTAPEKRRRHQIVGISRLPMV